jgi:hypothetical protein
MKTWLPAILWAALIFGTSCTVVTRDAFIGTVGPLIPGAHGNPEGFAAFWKDNWVLFVKGWHATEFFVLTLLINRWLRSVALSAIAAALFAMSDEYHQTFVSARGGRWSDVAIDCGGILLATVAVAIWRRRK